MRIISFIIPLKDIKFESENIICFCSSNKFNYSCVLATIEIYMLYNYFEINLIYISKILFFWRFFYIRLNSTFACFTFLGL